MATNIVADMTRCCLDQDRDCAAVHSQARYRAYRPVGQAL
jgi:hypothetical protein